LVELRQADGNGREVIAVALVLALEPARPDAVHEAAAGNIVDARRHLREEGGRAIGVARDEEPDLDARGLARQRRERGEALELRLPRRADDAVEVVVEEDGVVAERIGLAPVRRERVEGGALLRG